MHKIVLRVSFGSRQSKIPGILSSDASDNCPLRKNFGSLLNDLINPLLHIVQ